MNKLRRVVALMMLLCLQACGGVGSGSDNSWLVFAPVPVEATVMEGTSAELLVTANSTRTISETLYIKILDSQAVTTGTADLSEVTSTQFVAHMMLSPTLPVGVHEGRLQVWLYTDPEMTKPYDGSPWSVPYKITVGARRTVHRLLADRRALAFTALPNPAASRLSGVINISDNLGKTTAWSAVSSQPWLTVTPSGKTRDGANVLSLTADPATLPANVISYATVTVSSTDNSVVNHESIRVGVWKGSTNPVPHALEIVSYENIADQAAPFIYSHTYLGSTIDVVHAYSGGVVATLDAGPGVTLGKMATSSDGKRLFVTDWSSTSVIVFDLVNRTKLATWPVAGVVYDDTPIQYLRPNGIEVLAVGVRMMSAATGEAYGAQLSEPVFAMVANAQGGTLYSISPFEILYKWSLDFIDYGGIGLTVDKTLERRADYGDGFLIGLDLSLSPDSSQVYSYRTRASTVDFSLLGELPSVDIDSDFFDPVLRFVSVGADGRVYGVYSGDSMVVMSPTGAKLARLTTTRGFGRPVVSSDGLVCMVSEGPFDVSPRLRIEPILP
ncbi:MAG: hypothetical protein U1F53_17595 [Burkholderiaceae bacterium]